MQALRTASVVFFVCAIGFQAFAQEEDSQRVEDTVYVEGSRSEANYSADTTSSLGYSSIDILEVPQSVQVLTRDLIDDTGALSLGELLQNVPGSANSLSRTTPFGTASLQLRGQSAVIYRDGLRDIDFSDIDQSALNNVERIDVVKGPAGLVYGTGGPGGVVNIITKRPLEEFAANASITLGERDTKIVALDVSSPLGAGFGVRVTGELERSDSFIDFSEVERDNYSIAFGYDNGGPFDGTVMYENMANRDDNAMTRVGLPPSGTIIDRDLVQIDRSTYLGEPAHDFTDSFGDVLSVLGGYQIGDDWKFNLALRRTTVNFDQAEVRTLGALDPVTLTVPRSRARELELELEHYNARGVVTGAFDTGALSHELSVGYEFFDYYLFIDNRSVPNAQVPPIDVVNPTYLDAPFTTGAPFIFTSDEITHELFIQDVIRFGDATITAAVRQVDANFTDSFGLDENLADTLYQIGGTYALTDQISAFVGYNTGFDANSGIAADRSRTGERFEPEHFSQYEIGLKTRDFAGVSATLSLFQIARDGILVTDPLDAAFLVQVGKEESEGAEIEVNWRPNAAFTMTGGYLYLDTEVVEDTDPTRIGLARAGAPQNRFNVFASYTFQAGPLQDLRLSGGVSHTGESFASALNQLEQPAYTLVDLGASYTIGRYRLDAILSNALDEEFYIARNEFTVNAGDPRLFRLRASVEF
tara:strand:- start:10548 stop:12650 length:2103 start_codon:yes stop_codon:yes gene_type:complete